MQKVFYFSLMCLLCGACLAGPIDIDNEGALGINNNWEIEVKSVAGEYEHNTAIPPKPLHEVLHVHHVPVTIPLHTSIVVHDKHQYQQQTLPQDTPVQPTYNPHGRDSDENSCKAPNGAGFTRLFAEVYELLPKQKIVKIISNAYKHDAQVRAFRNILFSTDVFEKLIAIGQSNEFKEITDYACKRLYLDIKSYLQVVRLIMAAKQEEYVTNVSHDEPESSEEPQSTEFNGRPGVRGLMQDIYDVLPRDELRQLYKRLKNTDYYLAYGIRNVKAPEFRHLLDNLRFVPEYKELRDILVKAGMPLNEYNKIMAAAMGWEDEGKVFTA